MRLFLCLSIFVFSSFFGVTALSVTELSITATENKDCSVTAYDDTAFIKYIHDGDTLHLKDGRKIRLIGINTPELARKSKPAEPYAAAAKDALIKLFKKNKTARLIFGKDKKDHYGRYLAHVFSADGQNVQAALLKQGYASAIMIPPNTRFSTCYLEMEKTARCNHREIWQNDGVIEAKNLNNKTNGFHLVRGLVKSIDTNDKGIWLNLDNKLTVGIRPDNHALFDRDTINSWRNQPITVRGWLNKNTNRKTGSTPFYMRVRDPSSIQLSSAFSCS